jgi:hypothetical protein
VYEDLAFVNGALEEVAIDYFAQDDAGTVYYLGEEVTDYDESGKEPERGQGETCNERRGICARMLAGRSTFRALGIQR